MLYGTSYGTKVAERYAQTYPSHVSALVLDSVVPPNGPEPLNLPTFAAIPRVLRQLCAGRTCAHITPEPVADLTKLVRRMGGGALSGRWIDGDGRTHTLRFSANTLLNVLIAGDLEPALRAEFPAAVRSAADGDDGAVRALAARCLRTGRRRRRRKPERELRHAAVLRDQLRRGAVWMEPRLQPGHASGRSQGADQGAGSESDRAVRSGQRARHQRHAGVRVLAVHDPAPAPVQTPLPSVPTLILSGADDLRTPTANAREVAAQIPGSHVVVVPEVGHSVLGSDLSGCSSKALQALFKPSPIEPCTAGGLQILGLLKLAPLAPVRLSDVPPAGATAGCPDARLRRWD